MSDMRIDLLEKKVEVMQNEIGDVINEMHVTIQGLARMVTVALKSMDARLTAIEPKSMDNTDVPKPREGVDL